MKVLFISRIYPNDYNEDGRVIHSQAIELIKLGCEVKVISPIPKAPIFLTTFKDSWKKYSMLPYKNTLDGVEVFHPKYIKIPEFILKNMFDKVLEKSFTNTVLKTIQKSLSDFNFDIVHCHMTYPYSIIIKHIKNMFEVPVVVSARSSDLDNTIKHSNRVRLMSMIYNQADIIITPSIQLKDKLNTYFEREGFFIGNGIYPQSLKEVINNDLEGKFEDNFVIMSVSNLINSKGIDINIKAISILKEKIPNIKYIVIGEGPDKNNLLKLADKLGVKNNILFLGQLDHEQAMNYINICDVFSLPSKRETFGLVYLEALFYNKPIILCEGQAIAGVVEHDKDAVLVPKDSPEVVSSYILKMYQNLKYRKSISNNGKELVLNNFTWEIIGRELLRLYSSILNSHY